MPTIRVPPGIVRGESKAMVPGRFYDGNLIRWQGDLLMPVGGHERINASALLSIPRHAHSWNDGDGNLHRAIICDNKVYRVFGSEFTDITPADFIDANTVGAQGFGSGLFGQKDYGMDDEFRGPAAVINKRPIHFIADNWNTELLFGTTADGRIWVWSPAVPGTAPSIAVGAPTLVQSFLVTDEHHLMVFGYSGFRNRIAWSGQNNRTDWDYTAVTGSAGFFDLENVGFIYRGMKIPGGILVFTSSGVWLGRYIGAPYYYGFVKIADGAVPISSHAMAAAGSRVFWMGNNSFWKYEGGVVSPMETSLGRYPFDVMSKTAAHRRVTCGFNGQFPEIWWFLPEEQDLSPVQIENSRYVIFNVERGWWADGYMDRSFFVSSPLDGLPFAGDGQGWVYQHEQGYKDEGASRGDRVYAEIGSVSFDDGANNWTVNQCQIDSALGPESVKFSFQGRRVRGGPEVDLGEYIPRPNGFLDTHFTARDFSMRITGQVDAPWSLGAFVFHNVQKRGPA